MGKKFKEKKKKKSEEEKESQDYLHEGVCPLINTLTKLFLGEHELRHVQ